MKHILCQLLPQRSNGYCSLYRVICNKLFLFVEHTLTHTHKMKLLLLLFEFKFKMAFEVRKIIIGSKMIICSVCDFMNLLNKISFYNSFNRNNKGLPFHAFVYSVGIRLNSIDSTKGNIFPFSLFSVGKILRYVKKIDDKR